jgi:hypothetical protein
VTHLLQFLAQVQGGGGAVIDDENPHVPNDLP